VKRAKRMLGGCVCFAVVVGSDLLTFYFFFVFLHQVYKPLDIRGKKTRALRRKLSPEQAAKKTVKATKKAKHFPIRKFAVKA